MTRKPTIIPILIIGFLGLLPLSDALAEGYCGDGAHDAATEECDDGNFINRDGCSSYCKIEDLTPPTVASVSIPNNSTGVPTTTTELTVSFSEPINPSTLNTINNVRLERNAIPLPITLKLESDGKTLSITVGQDLFAESSHALRIKNVKDVPGNIIAEEFISVFETGTLIDHTPPNVVINPPGGTYTFAQNVELIPYLDSYTGSEDFRDLTAKIYYTLDGSNPTDQSTRYTTSIPIRAKSTLKYYAIDSGRNRSPIRTETYNFTCPDLPNSKKATGYPSCTIQECNIGFVLRGNACVVSLEGADPDDYKTNAVTAPLFSSSKAMTITSKPAIYITPQHKGILPRPIVFQDLKRGIIIRFEQNTKILDKDGKAFSGYIRPPNNLYTKDYPINFGYTFKSIFEFKAADGSDLTFKPPYHITVPYTEAFSPNEGVSIFTYNPKTESYTAYDKKLYSFDLAKKQVTFTSGKTGAFFLAQSGKSFNKAVFKDIEGHWAKNYIEALYRKGIVKGKDNGIFAPNELLTRAEFIKIALKAAGIETPDPDSVRKAPFRDSPLDAWFTPAMAKAKELGLIKGFSDSSIRPGKTINRAEALKILITAFGFDLAPKKDEKPANSARNFRDLPATQWFAPFIDFALRNKLVDGPKDKNGNALKLFGPDKSMSRAEMAKITIKAIEFQEEIDKANTATLP